MDRYLSSFHDGQKIYYLNKEGRERVNCDIVRKKTFNVNHYLMRNDVYIAYGCPKSWKNEQRIFYQKGKHRIVAVCDAKFEMNDSTYIVEVDNTQTMKKNETKIEKYRRLVERNVLGRNPKFIWVTTTNYRRNLLTELCEGLNVEVYLSTDFH